MRSQAMIGRSRCALQATRAALIVSRLHLLPPTSQPSVLIRSARFQMQRVDAMIRWMYITAAARGRACLRGRCLWQRLARNAHVSSRRSAQHAVVACAAYRWPAARAGLRAFRRALGRVSYRLQAPGRCYLGDKQELPARASIVQGRAMQEFVGATNWSTLRCVVQVSGSVRRASLAEERAAAT